MRNEIPRYESKRSASYLSHSGLGLGVFRKTWRLLESDRRSLVATNCRDRLKLGFLGTIDAKVTRFSTIQAEAFGDATRFLLLRDRTFESGSFLTVGLGIGEKQRVARASEMGILIFGDIANTSFARLTSRDGGFRRRILGRRAFLIFQFALVSLLINTDRLIKKKFEGGGSSDVDDDIFDTGLEILVKQETF